MFGKKKENNLFHALQSQGMRISEEEAAKTKLVFHIEASYYGEHGALVGSFMRQGIESGTISFFFVGMARPPHLSKDVIDYIWKEAKKIGIVPKYIYAYEGVMKPSSR